MCDHRECATVWKLQNKSLSKHSRSVTMEQGFWKRNAIYFTPFNLEAFLYLDLCETK